jgi:hypothetical protein
MARHPKVSMRAPPSSGPAGRARLPIPAQIPIALACSSGLGEGVADDRQRARQQEGGADPLEDPRPDQQARAEGGAAGERGDPEDGQPGEDDALVAVEVADGAVGQHQAGQGDGVAVHYPLQVADVRPQPRADAGQGDVDDGHVEQDQEVAGAHHHQQRPPRTSPHPCPPAA